MPVHGQSTSPLHSFKIAEASESQKSTVVIPYGYYFSMELYFTNFRFCKFHGFIVHK